MAGRRLGRSGRRQRRAHCELRRCSGRREATIISAPSIDSLARERSFKLSAADATLFVSEVVAGALRAPPFSSMNLTPARSRVAAGGAVVGGIHDGLGEFGAADGAARPLVFSQVRWSSRSTPAGADLREEPGQRTANKWTL